MNGLLKVMPQHLNWIQVWTLTIPLQNLVYLFIYLCFGLFGLLTHWEIDLLVCFRSFPAAKLTCTSASHQKVIAEHFLISGKEQNSWRKQGTAQTLITASSPGPGEVWHAHTIIPPPPCLTVGLNYSPANYVIFLKCCVIRNTASKKFNFCLVRE